MITLHSSFAGETHEVKQKLTRIGVLKGEEAKAVNRTRRDGLCIAYVGAKGKERLEFYKVRNMERKIIEAQKEKKETR